MLSLPPAICAWLDMLRTTHLPQRRGLFEGGGSYCALGICCLANGQPPLRQEPEFGLCGNWGYVESLLGKRGAHEVYCRNDVLKYSFPQIADWAEVYFSEHGPHIGRCLRRETCEQCDHERLADCPFCHLAGAPNPGHPQEPSHG